MGAEYPLPLAVIFWPKLTPRSMQSHGLFATAELLVNLHISGMHGCILTKLIAIIHHYNAGPHDTHEIFKVMGVKGQDRAVTAI